MILQCRPNGELSGGRKSLALRFVFCIPLHKTDKRTFVPLVCHMDGEVGGFMKGPVSARSKIYRIALDAVLLAVNVVMNVAVPSEFSWASLPVLLCAFLMRPADAVAVATIGSFIEQLFYGLNYTTVFWMLPWVVFSLYVGIGASLARRSRHFFWTIFVLVTGELLLNICNTTALLGFGYVHIDPSAFSSGLPMPLVAILTYIVRMPQAAIRAVLSAVVVPLLLPPLRRVLSRYA